MNVFHAFTAITASGPLASRAFLPLFLILLFASNGDMSQDAIGYQLTLPDYLAWLTSREALAVLGLLALAECFAEKYPELQEMLDSISSTAKLVASGIVALAILPDQAVSGPAVQEASVLGSGVTVAGSVGATWYLTRVRSSFYTWLRDIDPDDSLGIYGLISWIEDGWGIAGVIAFVIVLFLPFLSILLVGIFLIFVWLIKLLIRRAEDRDKRPCPHCGEGVLSFAAHCNRCQQDVPVQKLANWGWFAASTENEREHRIRMVAINRCPKCADRMKPRTFIQDGCAGCGFQFAPHDPWFEEYREKVVDRARRLFVPLTAVSLIPGAGFAISLVLIRLTLVSPLSIFLPAGKKFGLRWGMRFATILLLLLGCIPVLSMAAAPILLLLHLRVYGNAAARNVDLVVTPPAAAKS